MLLKRTLSHLVATAGGPRRFRTIVLLACVLGLDSADLATVGAVAAQLEHGLGIGDLKLGILASVVSLVAALATLPIGWLTDRVARVPLLAGSIALWTAAMVASGAAASFTMLLVTRMFLAAVQATSGPTLASLTGDLFPARERGRIFGFIHTGELAGAGFGFVVSGEVAAVLSWRWAFWILAIPGVVLAVAMWRLLPEPERGGAGRLARSGAEPESEEIVHRLVREQEISPDPGLVLDEDPRRMSPWRALRYLLRIRSNLALIAAVALGYFFLGGARTFGILFIRGHFGLGQATATALGAVLGVGAIGGVLAGGRITDRRLQDGKLASRMVIGGIGYLAAALLFAPPLAITVIWISLPLFVVATGALSAATPPLDAARLDVVPGPMWGRAEGIQTAVRTFAQALAPVMFGFVADLFSSSGAHAFGRGTFGSSAHGSNGGLAFTFLIMLVPLAAAGLVAVRARQRYRLDVATAVASEEAARVPGG